MTQREFKPGVYTHYKEGTKYLAYEDTTDEATQLPRISYFALDKPEKKWNREIDIFMAPADPDPEINKTGQEWKFEFFSNEFPVYTRTDGLIYFVRDITHAFKHLHIGEPVRVVSQGSEITGTIEHISYTGLIINRQGSRFATIPWTDILQLYKIYGG